jgi:hypothetical protein
MGILKDLGKVGLGGIAGIVANKGMLPKYSGIGMLQRELGMGKKRRAEEAMAKAGGTRGRPMVEDIMVAQEGPAMRRDGMQNIQTFKKGGKVKKMAKGGSTASKRGDGIATKGKTKGRFV